MRQVHRGEVLIDAHIVARVIDEFRRLSRADGQTPT